MKFGLKEIRIEMQPFDFDVCCVIGDYKNLAKYAKWKFEDNNFDVGIGTFSCQPRGRMIARQGYVPVLWIPRFPVTARELATLAHESLHCVYVLFEWASIPMTKDTEEVCAHAMAHIVTTVLKGKRK